MQVASENFKEVILTHKSWLEASTIKEFQEIGTSGYDTNNNSTGFFGLGASDSSKCVIDGNGDSLANENWWNCIGAINTHISTSSTGIPGSLQKIASSMHLYIWAPGNL